MVKGDTKCFSIGSAAPSLDPNGVTLYSMRFCPFVERVRVVLAAKQIPHEIVNINLRSKPDWFLKRNPLGKVPMIEEPGHKITYESVLLAEYLDDKFDTGMKILPSDHYERTKQKMQVQVMWDKLLSIYLAVMFEGRESDLKAFEVGLEEVEAMLTDKFFSGPNVGFVDMMVWPFLHRIPNLKELRGLNIAKEKYPKILEWTERMREFDFIKTTVYPLEQSYKFEKDYIVGRPNYDECL